MSPDVFENQYVYRYYRVIIIRRGVCPTALGVGNGGPARTGRQFRSHRCSHRFSVGYKPGERVFIVTTALHGRIWRDCAVFDGTVMRYHILSRTQFGGIYDYTGIFFFEKNVRCSPAIRGSRNAVKKRSGATIRCSAPFNEMNEISE